MVIKDLYSYKDVLNDEYNLVCEPRRAIIDCLKYCYCEGFICRDDCVELMLHIELAHNNHQMAGPLSSKELMFLYDLFYGDVE